MPNDKREKSKFKMDPQSGNSSDLVQLKALVSAWIRELVKGLETNAEQASPELEEITANLKLEVLRLLHSKNIETGALEAAIMGFPNLDLTSRDAVREALVHLNDELSRIIANTDVESWLRELKTYYQRILHSNSELMRINEEIERSLSTGNFNDIRPLMMQFWNMFLAAEQNAQAVPSQGEAEAWPNQNDGQEAESDMYEDIEYDEGDTDDDYEEEVTEDAEIGQEGQDEEKGDETGNQ